MAPARRASRSPPPSSVRWRPYRQCASGGLPRRFFRGRGLALRASRIRWCRATRAAPRRDRGRATAAAAASAIRSLTGTARARSRARRTSRVSRLQAACWRGGSASTALRCSPARGGPPGAVPGATGRRWRSGRDTPGEGRILGWRHLTMIWRPKAMIASGGGPISGTHSTESAATPPEILSIDAAWRPAPVARMREILA